MSDQSNKRQPRGAQGSLSLADALRASQVKQVVRQAAPAPLPPKPAKVEGVRRAPQPQAKVQAAQPVQPQAPRAAQPPRPPRPPQAPRPPQPPRAERAPRPAAPAAQPQAAPAPRPPREPREPREPRPSRADTAALRTSLPPITFPEELPVSGRRAEIAKAIQENQVIIVSGETGSGKTTQLPKICLELGRGQAGLIGHTQPRRIAASSTAKRIAQELGSPQGVHVGFKVRFTDTLQPGASVKLMTDGILLAETQTDPMMRAYDTIIIDEAHERSLNIDFLLGYLKQLLPRRPDLKVIITSATIDAERFARHFGSADKPAPVIEVSGRLYQVEVR